MDDDLRLEVRSDPRLLGCVRSLVRAWLEARGVGAEKVEELVLAIDEGCANAIRHSYRGDCHRSLELVMRTDAGVLEVRLSDHGLPCPPSVFEQRPLEAPDPGELRPGGLGVQLMHRTFDEVVFRPGGETGNCVILRTRIGE